MQQQVLLLLHNFCRRTCTDQKTFIVFAVQHTFLLAKCGKYFIIIIFCVKGPITKPNSLHLSFVHFRNSGRELKKSVVFTFPANFKVLHPSSEPVHLQNRTVSAAVLCLATKRRQSGTESTTRLHFSLHCERTWHHSCRYFNYNWNLCYEPRVWSITQHHWSIISGVVTSSRLPKLCSSLVAFPTSRKLLPKISTCRNAGGDVPWKRIWFIRRCLKNVFKQCVKVGYFPLLQYNTSYSLWSIVKVIAYIFFSDEQTSLKHYRRHI